MNGMLRAGFVELLRSADLARVYALAALGTALSGFAIERLTSSWTLYAMIAGLCVIGAAILLARRRELTLIGFAPTMLFAFVLWALLSVLWSFDRWGTFTSWVELAAYGFVAVVIAQVRDTMQTVRALGDVLRALLAVSLGLEILVGILLDTSFEQLGVLGDIAFGGPVQGIFGTRNMLGFVTVIALVTFLVEWRTRSVPRGLSVASLVLAIVLALFSASPTVLVLAIVVATALGALSLIRRVAPERRLDVQRVIGVSLVLLAALTFLFRGRVIATINAATDFSNRSELWGEAIGWVSRRAVQGWGWHGTWEGEPFPFDTINFLVGETHAQALNAYLDVLLQLGWVGVLLFGGMCLIALARGWVMASERRSSVYMWLPLMLVTLLGNSMLESFTLSGPGWLLLVLCIVGAGQARSWRRLILDRPPEPEPLGHERLDR